MRTELVIAGLGGLAMLLFQAVFWGVFIWIAVVVGRRIAAGVRESRTNRATPPEQRDALVVAKRSDVSGGNDSMASTTYYVTFEFAEGMRQEFRVPGQDYGLMTEGDRGVLARQGTWFRGFQRLNLTPR